MWQVLSRFAIGWGVFLALPCLVLLFVLDRGTAEFAVTVLTFGMGMLMVLMGVAVTAFVRYREDRVVAPKARDRRPRG